MWNNNIFQFYYNEAYIIALYIIAVLLYCQKKIVIEGRIWNAYWHKTVHVFVK
jgi:hypothetical protein